MSLLHVKVLHKTSVKIWPYYVVSICIPAAKRCILAAFSTSNGEQQLFKHSSCMKLRPLLEVGWNNDVPLKFSLLTWDLGLPTKHIIGISIANSYKILPYYVLSFIFRNILCFCIHFQIVFIFRKYFPTYISFSLCSYMRTSQCIWDFAIFLHKILLIACVTFPYTKYI